VPLLWGRREFLLAALLAIATLVTYSPLWQCDFVSYDDTGYVTENTHVQEGLTRESIAWAWTTTHMSNWHPLTWLSLELDAQFYGLDPFGFHLTNLLLHLGNTLLLFGLLVRMTGAVWRSVFVAALFALHPLHVESVAWVSERKDVLSTLFGLLALWAYARFAETPQGGWYVLVVLFLALSLLAKPMLVTLPFLLLLLDYWPLCRWQPHGKSGLTACPAVQRPVSLRWLLLEKIPLFCLCVAFCAVALWTQEQSGSVTYLEHLPLLARLANAAVSYVQYLGQTIVPVNLAPFYPHPIDSLDPWWVVGASLLLLGLTVLILGYWRRCPYLAVGWLWYLGTLVPVIGLVQVGLQARADRYTYIPLVGIFLLSVWGLADLTRSRQRQRALACLGGLALVGLLLTSWNQVHYWQNSFLLWERDLMVTGGNAVAHTNMGKYLQTEGRTEEAIRHWKAALAFQPSFLHAHFQLGKALLSKGDLAGAVDHLEQVVRSRPNDPHSQNGLGVAYLLQGKLSNAVHHLQEAIRLTPKVAVTHCNLGQALLRQERWAEAAAAFREAVALIPEEALHHRLLAFALHKQGQSAPAEMAYQDSLRLDPAWPERATRAAWVLATDLDISRRNGARAIQEAEQACQATGEQDPRALDALAAAYAECGRFSDAVALARKALAQASASGHINLAGEIEARLRLYQRGYPFRADRTGD
jgi:tetratricopeptide (TPR) repeat protein